MEALQASYPSRDACLSDQSAGCGSAHVGRSVGQEGTPGADICWVWLL
jgi:hypothetical protein